jgi:hypothetical protein
MDNKKEKKKTKKKRNRIKKKFSIFLLHFPEKLEQNADQNSETQTNKTTRSDPSTILH